MCCSQNNHPNAKQTPHHQQPSTRAWHVLMIREGQKKHGEVHKLQLKREETRDRSYAAVGKRRTSRKTARPTANRRIEPPLHPRPTIEPRAYKPSSPEKRKITKKELGEKYRLQVKRDEMRDRYTLQWEREGNTATHAVLTDSTYTHRSVFERPTEVLQNLSDLTFRSRCTAQCAIITLVRSLQNLTNVDLPRS